MTCGHPLSDLRGRAASCQTVAKYFRIPARTIQDLYQEYYKKGHKLHTKPGIEMQGVKRMLTINFQIVVGWVECSGLLFFMG